MSSEGKKYNRLINEKSPYLLQHAENPVDWYPWGEEAFEKARKEDKPIFLSIGYATCHWCHVMEHESFEDEDVARLLNQTFVCIKVDREERPDVDDVYMTVCQMMTGSGGWPLTIMMTPDKKPFFAGTYIPKESRYGRMGLLQLIPRVQELWETQRQELLNSAEKVNSALSQHSEPAPGSELSERFLNEAYQQFSSSYDEKYGGFGSAPKFPTAHNLMFLLRYWKRSGDSKALEMVENTLRKMQLGGVYDHIGFGFHRYSTDREWLLPHFEKMLYDQAILSMAYSEAYQATGNEFYRRVAEEIFTYVLRDMTDAKGGFYSAEDADSEGEEGKFYVWTEEEIRQILNEDEADLVVKTFNVKKEGNFHEQTTREKTGTNILYLKKPLAEIATKLKMPESELQQKLESARQKLFAVREKRVHPLKDDKILTDWNGLMIAALAKAARAFDNSEYATAAQKAAEFILTTMQNKNGRLMHRYRDGEVAIRGYLDDYAFVTWGLLELYETTFEVKYLQAALELTGSVQEHFWDKQNGGFFFTANDAEELLVRKKEIYDGAIPSGNSVMMLNLVRLGRITGNTDFEDTANRIGRAFSATVSRQPSAYSLLLTALDFAVGPSHEIVIVGEKDGEDTKQMIQAVNNIFVTNKVVLLKPTGSEENAIVKIAPFTKELTSLDNRATAYVCQNYHCDLPTADVEKMLVLLGVSRE